MEFFNNHKNLFRTAFLLFAGLTLVVAILPALSNQANNRKLPDARELTDAEMEGKKIYIANGCVACHSQQVRNVDMDKMFGTRPGIAADYATSKRTDFWRNTATLMGTERTGPDLSNIGNRQPSLSWHLLHLYQPRAVVQRSIMPAYPWLFEEKTEIGPGDVEVKLPAAFSPADGKKIVAGKEALRLVAYLQSLRQVPLPDGTPDPAFLYARAKKTPVANGSSQLPDGLQLYAQYCQSCHQANGEGLPGAFPPLKNSPVVLGNDLDLYVNIIMNGYDPRPSYASMPAIGRNNDLTAEDLTAIINHERSSWGNKASPVSLADVKKIYDYIKSTENK